MLERVGRVQVVKYGWVIDNLKRLDGQRSVARTIHAFIAAIAIIVLFEGCTRALMRSGYFRLRCTISCRCHMSVHGMGTFMKTITHDGQHDHEEESGKEMSRNIFNHSFFDIVRLYSNCQESIEGLSRGWHPGTSCTLFASKMVMVFLLTITQHFIYTSRSYLTDFCRFSKSTEHKLPGLFQHLLFSPDNVIF